MLPKSLKVWNSASKGLTVIHLPLKKVLAILRRQAYSEVVTGEVHMEDAFIKTERNLASLQNALEVALQLIKEMNAEYSEAVDKL